MPLALWNANLTWFSCSFVLLQFPPSCSSPILGSLCWIIDFKLLGVRTWLYFISSVKRYAHQGHTTTTIWFKGRNISKEAIFGVLGLLLILFFICLKKQPEKIANDISQEEMKFYLFESIIMPFSVRSIVIIQIASSLEQELACTL